MTKLCKSKNILIDDDIKNYIEKNLSIKLNRIVLYHYYHTVIYNIEPIILSDKFYNGYLEDESDNRYGFKINEALKLVTDTTLFQLNKNSKYKDLYSCYTFNPEAEEEGYNNLTTKIAISLLEWVFLECIQRQTNSYKLQNINVDQDDLSEVIKEYMHELNIYNFLAKTDDFSLFELVEKNRDIYNGEFLSDMFLFLNNVLIRNKEKEIFTNLMKKFLKEHNLKKVPVLDSNNIILISLLNNFFINEKTTATDIEIFDKLYPKKGPNYKSLFWIQDSNIIDKFLHKQFIDKAFEIKSSKYTLKEDDEDLHIYNSISNIMQEIRKIDGINGKEITLSINHDDKKTFKLDSENRVESLFTLDYIKFIDYLYNALKISGTIFISAANENSFDLYGCVLHDGNYSGLSKEQLAQIYNNLDKNIIINNWDIFSDSDFYKLARSQLL